MASGLVVFSGQSKEILVQSGVTEINVQEDLYSPWKEWVATSDNAKYLHAFRTVGGDPTSAGQYSPRYFFLMNGWRVVVDGSLTPSVDFAINLYVDEGGSPFTIINGANVSNLRSDVGVVESEVAQVLDYGGAVYYDEVGGQSGTTYPTGTAYQPVNNIPDLQTLLSNLDIHVVILRSDMNCVTGTTFSQIRFESKTAAEWIYFAGEPDGFDGCYFYTLRAFGDVGCTSSGSGVVFKDVALTNLWGVNGIADNCHLMGTIQIAPDCNFNTSHCASGIPGNESPAIDMNPGVTTTLSIRGYSGGLKIYNCDQSGDTATIEYIAGKAHLLTGNTDGLISVRGILSLNDQTSGTTVDTSAMYDTSNEYDGVLHFSDGGFDSVSGTSYPVGTSRAPVDNWSDAVTIMNTYHLHDIYLHTSTTFTEPLTGKNISSVAGVVQVNVNGQRVDGSMFNNLYVYGDFANSYQAVLQNCFTNTLARFNGVLQNCALEGNVQCSVSGETTLMDCAGGDAGEIITFDKVAGSATTLNIRRYAGGVNIINSDTPGEKSAVVMDQGKVFLDSSCTDGQISVAGIAELTDNSGSGCTVNVAGLLETTFVYGDKVSYDAVNGFSGTTYPIGSSVSPVNNVSDLRAILTGYNLHTISLHSDIVVTEDLEGYKFISEQGISYVTLAGGSVDGSTFDRLAVNGDFVDSQCILFDCVVVSGYNWHGIMTNCELGGYLSLSHVSASTLAHCWEGVTDADQVIDLDGSPGLTIAGWHGGITLTNLNTAGSYVDAHVDVGNINIDSTCVSGTVLIDGLGYTTNSGTSTVDIDHLSDPELYYQQIQEILGLSQSNYKITGQVYDGSNNLTNATIYTYETAADMVSGSPVLHQYTMTAAYSGNNMTSYTVVKVS